MSVRTRADLVKDLLLKNYDTVDEPSLHGFIETASCLVDDVAVCAAEKGVTLTDKKLELIERWLAAHCYQRADPGYASNSTISASASYQGQTGLGLQGSYYGQMALDLDSSGCLLEVTGGVQEAGAYWLGKPRQSQRGYYDRGN